MELGPLQKAWIAALRSGEYRQGQHALCDAIDSEAVSYCCLGVAAVVVTGDKKPKGSFLPRSVKERLGLRSVGGSPIPIGPSLARLNDEGATFAEIADLLEANPPEYFERSV